MILIESSSKTIKMGIMVGVVFAIFVSIPLKNILDQK